MTTGNFRTVALSSIFIDDESRQRKELRGIEELAASIRNVGLINPPVVSPELKLIAGRRRIAACSLLGWTSIPVQLSSDLSELELQLLELEENVKRLDLSWQDQAKAITNYHELSLQSNPGWTLEKTAEAMGMSASWVGRYILVQQQAKVKPELLKLDKLSTAVSTATRQQERAKAVGLRELVGEAPVAAKPDRFAELLHASFFDFSPSEPFNFLHCDFPYGVNTGDKSGQAALHMGTYADGEEIYFNLLHFLCSRQDSFVAPEAHMMFWFAFKFYGITKELLEEAGWRVDPHPLIWHKSDNAGVIPDHMWGGRRTYESAFHCTRGDRKVAKPVAMSFSGPTSQLFHPTEKPVAMLQHFFQMYVDGTSRVLDPTCGSGNSIKVAELSGASYALGIEQDADFYKGAKENLKL